MQKGAIALKGIRKCENIAVSTTERIHVDVICVARRVSSPSGRSRDGKGGAKPVPVGIKRFQTQ